MTSVRLTEIVTPDMAQALGIDATSRLVRVGGKVRRIERDGSMARIALASGEVLIAGITSGWEESYGPDET